MADDTRRPILLSAEHLALLKQGVGVSVASRDAGNLPNLVRAVGHRVEPSGEVTVILSGTDGGGVLANLRANGAVAVVFSQPSTHRTLQVKANRVVIEEARPADLETVAQCREAMAAELTAIGFSGEFARQLLDAEHRDLVAVSFLPESAFDQTPGPKAGAPLAAG